MQGNLPLLVAVLLFVMLMLETRLMMRWRKDTYFAAALPLGLDLVPIPKPPTGSGRTATVRWEVSAPHIVRFWAEPSQRRAPMGLHGIVTLAQSRTGISLDVAWAPPWSALIAPCWLASLGISRGEGLLMVPLGALLLVGILSIYRERALVAAAELRWAFLQGEEEPRALE